MTGVMPAKDSGGVQVYNWDFHAHEGPLWGPVELKPLKGVPSVGPVGPTAP